MRTKKLEEIPFGIGMFYTEEDLSHLLPAALLGGYEIRTFQPAFVRGKADPAVLRDEWGHILYQWPDDYTPDWVDALQVCRQLKLI